MYSGSKDETDLNDNKKNLEIILFLISVIIGALTLYYTCRKDIDNWGLNVLKILIFVLVLVTVYKIIMPLISKELGFSVSLSINFILGLLILSYFFPLLPWFESIISDSPKTEIPSSVKPKINDENKPKTEKIVPNIGSKKKKDVLVYIHIGQFERATYKWVKTYISMDSLTKIDDLKKSNSFKTLNLRSCFISLPENEQEKDKKTNVCFTIDPDVRINIKDVVLGYNQNGIDHYFALIYLQK